METNLFQALETQDVPMMILAKEFIDDHPQEYYLESSIEGKPAQRRR